MPVINAHADVWMTFEWRSSTRSLKFGLRLHLYHTLCMRVDKAFANLRICADPHVSLLLADAIPKSRKLVHFVSYPLDIKRCHTLVVLCDCVNWWSYSFISFHKIPPSFSSSSSAPPPPPHTHTKKKKKTNDHHLSVIVNLNWSSLSDFVTYRICVHVKSYYKPVLSGHSKIDKLKILMANGGLLKVESIAECSLWCPAFSDNWSWKPFFLLFESGCFRQVLLYRHMNAQLHVHVSSGTRSLYFPRAFVYVRNLRLREARALARLSPHCSSFL